MRWKIARWSAGIGTVLFIGYRPHAAANVAGSIGRVLLDLGIGFGNFFTDLIT